jgi:hypothetical protein
MFKIYTKLYINKKNKGNKNNTFKSMLNLIKYRYKNFRTQKAYPNWIRKKKIGVIRELGKIYLKILIKIKVKKWKRNWIIDKLSYRNQWM